MKAIPIVVQEFWLKSDWYEELGYVSLSALSIFSACYVALASGNQFVLELTINNRPQVILFFVKCKFANLHQQAILVAEVDANLFASCIGTSGRSTVIGSPLHGAPARIHG